MIAKPVVGATHNPHLIEPCLSHVDDAVDMAAPGVMGTVQKFRDPSAIRLEVPARGGRCEGWNLREVGGELLLPRLLRLAQTLANAFVVDTDISAVGHRFPPSRTSRAGAASVAGPSLSFDCPMREEGSPAREILLDGRDDSGDLAGDLARIFLSGGLDHDAEEFFRARRAQQHSAGVT